MSKTGSDLFIEDNSDSDWKVHRYLKEWCELSKGIDVATGFFEVGGYQVCDKWLKDRGPKKGNPGRTLSDEDIAHYHKIVIAITETIRLMKEIDEVIDANGGWPDAFQPAQ